MDRPRGAVLRLHPRLALWPGAGAEAAEGKRRQPAAASGAAFDRGHATSFGEKDLCPMLADHLELMLDRKSLAANELRLTGGKSNCRFWANDHHSVSRTGSGLEKRPVNCLNLVAKASCKCKYLAFCLPEGVQRQRLDA
jgi:hypothetical protein